MDLALVQLDPDWGELPRNVHVLCTTRRYGTSPPPYDDGTTGGGLNLSTQVGDRPENVQLNRARVLVRLPSAPVWLMHGDRAETVDLDCISKTDDVWADGCISRTKGTVCAVLTADALPVLLADAEGTVVAAVRASWRGLATGVLERTVALMQTGSNHAIRAWLGAAIGHERFTVGEDVLRAFVEHHPEDRGIIRSAFRQLPELDRYSANLYTLARIALQRVAVHSISGGGLCTMSKPGRFYSVRRDGTTGRQASMIWIG